MRQTVYDFLGQSRIAQTHAGLGLGEGCAAAIWQNNSDQVRYANPANHTFSLYLQGGSGTIRTDADGARGFPGAVCVMPEGCGSTWEITAPFRFVHLYISDARLRSGFARTHDRDARRLSMSEVTFARHSGLKAALLALTRATEDHDPLQAETALAEFYGALDQAATPISAGLSPRVLRRVDDWIEAHLDQTIALADLARLADLSEFHFHRMFRLARGVAPYAWVTQRRIAHARLMLQTTTPISQIADACGFSNQSHLTRQFTRHTGLTPARYRKHATA